MPMLSARVEKSLLDALTELAARGLAPSRGELIRRLLWRGVREGIRRGRVAMPRVTIDKVTPKPSKLVRGRRSRPAES